MIHNLTDDQIDHIVRSQMIGRIGCSAKGKVYVVPTAYAYDGNYIYAHAKEGMKINVMRKHPRVCFQLDVIENLASWRSVILWGEYEELTSRPLQLKAIKLLNDRFTPVTMSESAKPSANVPRGPEKVEKLKRAVLYRISISEKSGRYEKIDFRD